jgi:hypothetical protein
MTIPLKTLAEITQEAFHILSREIGVANTLRFINQFTPGKGNYTEERRALYSEVDLDDLVSEIRRRRTER